MGKLNDLYKKVKYYFDKKEYTDGTSKPIIEIRDQHDSNPRLCSRSYSDTPRITIKEIHRAVDIQNLDIGYGITVRKQRKPNRCPLCATQGQIVKNTAGGDKWRCKECGSTFN